jgi:hypothetical protein
MAGHLLGMLKPSVVLQIDRDPGRPPGVTSNGRQKTCGLSPLPNRSHDVGFLSAACATDAMSTNPKASVRFLSRWVSFIVS